MGLIPREEQYFSLLSQFASMVKKGGEIFLKVFQDFQSHADYAEQIKNVELACDEQAAKITHKLNTSFITPIDREDILLLVTEMDDVIDMITDMARRIDIYDVKVPRPDVIGIAAKLTRATAEIQRAFALLEQHRNVGDPCAAIKQLENEADRLYSEALRCLFKEEKDPFEVIKWMAIYEELESCVDRCKDVAEALEGIMVKSK
jgi:predicted phosphate transport protein (TIGR00153 family)